MKTARMMKVRIRLTGEEWLRMHSISPVNLQIYNQEIFQKITLVTLYL